MLLTNLFLIGLGLLPGLVWLIFYLREDTRHPEPRKLIFYTFLAGALVTVFVLQFQYQIHLGITSGGLHPYGIVSFLFLAVVEEVFKFLAVYLVVSRRKEFDEPIDAMIYMVVAALGFATVENVASVFNAGGVFPSPGPIETTILRFVGATLLHTLSSGLVGYYWGKALAKGKKPLKAIAGGLLLATLLHAFFNFLIIRSEPIALPLIFLLFFALFVLSDFEKLKRVSP
ncbi:MAG: PrsW family intramembrane metalloprotease [Candidatus Harrisonbacteria bacterium]|nr:PrsW family intramembrane metalloprotease [Candidatus Harrisonbacteria bacterium]